jgi:hypothetical protein
MKGQTCLDSYIKCLKFGSTFLFLVQNVEQQNVKQHNVKQQNVEQQNVEQQNVEQQNVEQQNVEQQNVKQQNVKQQNVKQQNGNFLIDDNKMLALFPTAPAQGLGPHPK